MMQAGGGQPNPGYDTPMGDKPPVVGYPEATAGYNQPQPGYNQQNPQTGPVVQYGAQQQVAPVTTTTVTVVNVPIQNMLLRQNQKDWTSGICGCCEDIASCCYSYWCFPCFMCSLSAKLEEFPCGPFCCGHIFMIPMRTKTRSMYGIRGTICKDLCCVFWCTCCAMTQMWRELEAMGPM